MLNCLNGFRPPTLVGYEFPLARRGEVFGDQVMAVMTGRIVHHADVIALKGASYRIKHTVIESLHLRRSRPSGRLNPVSTPAHFSTGRSCAAFDRSRQCRLRFRFAFCCRKIRSWTSVVAVADRAQRWH